YVFVFVCFFFSSRRRHTRFSRDWSSDVCSSDLAPGRIERDHAREQRHVPAPLDEAERGVAEGRRDRERGEGALVPLDVLDVGNGRAAPRFEQGERALGVAHAERDRADPVRVFGEEAVRTAALSHRSRAHDRTVTGAKRERALAIPGNLLGAALADDREIEAIDVEATTPVEIAHVVVNAFDSEDSERL